MRICWLHCCYSLRKYTFNENEENQFIVVRAADCADFVQWNIIMSLVLPTDCSHSFITRNILCSCNFPHLIHSQLYWIGTKKKKKQITSNWVILCKSPLNCRTIRFFTSFYLWQNFSCELILSINQCIQIHRRFSRPRHHISTMPIIDQFFLFSLVTDCSRCRPVLSPKSEKKNNKINKIDPTQCPSISSRTVGPIPLSFLSYHHFILEA